MQGSNLSKTADLQGNSGASSPIASLFSGEELENLDLVVESWAGLPLPFKSAILAIVRSSEAGK